MEITPLLSIIIPVYNAGKYLHRCLESILNQSYSDWELLLINDGSKDNSGNICDEYARRDERIKVWHTDNRGQSAARNLALDNCKGKFITFVDADDYLVGDETLQAALTAIQAHKTADIVQFPFIGSGWTNSTEGLHLHDSLEAISGTKAYLENFGIEGIDGWFYPAPWAKVYRQTVIGKLRFAEGRVFEDSLFLTQLFPRIKSILPINEGLYAYPRNEEGTMAGAATRKKFNDSLESHLVTLEAAKDSGIEEEKYSSFYNVEFNNVWCSVAYYKENFYPRQMLTKLHTLRPGKNFGSRKIKLLIRIASFLGYHRFFALESYYRKFLSKVRSS